MLCWLLVYSQGVSIELHKFWFSHDDLMCCVGGTSKEYAFDRPALPSLWLCNKDKLTQIEMVALEEAGFLLLEKLRYSLVNKVGDDIFAFINQPSACALQNLFSDGISVHVYKPLDPDAWCKSRNGKKICRLSMFKLSILQENK